MLMTVKIEIRSLKNGKLCVIKIVPNIVGLAVCGENDYEKKSRSFH